MPIFNDRTGETCINNQGYIMKIIKYRNSHDIDVQFNDELNTIYQHKKLTDFYKGKIKNPNHYVGKETIANNGMKCKIISGNSRNLTVLFDDGVINSGIRYNNFCNGIIKNKNCLGCMSIGKLNTEETEYTTSKNTSYYSIYRTWNHMIERCNSEKYKLNHATYQNCTSSDNFLSFDYFYNWYLNNLWNENFTILDKDLLIKGNKIYSENTCVLVDRKLNNLILKSNANRGEFPIGVHKASKGNNFETSMNGKYLGTFPTIEEAFMCYKKAKEDYIKRVADEYKSKYKNFPEKLYEALYNYKVEITD